MGIGIGKAMALAETGQEQWRLLKLRAKAREWQINVGKISHQLKEVTAQVKKHAKEGWDNFRASLVKQLRSAKARQDFRQAHTIVRQLAATGVGKKKRKFRVPNWGYNR